MRAISAKLEKYFQRYSGTILDKTEKKKILNPKRIKILAGMLVILAFSIVLDFVAPVSGSHFEGKDVKFYYDQQLDWYTGLIKLYKSKNGTLPTTILGGDHKGYLSIRDEIPDQLLFTSNLDIYQKVNFNSIENKHDLIEFKMRHPMYNVLFGKNGDRVMNIRAIDPDILREYLKDAKNFPLINQMYYEILENGRSFQVFFVLPQMDDSEYKKFRNVPSWTDLDYGCRGFSYSDTSKIPIYGMVCRYIDGKWQSQKFFLGGQ
jgi:hypothetical protein